MLKSFQNFEPDEAIQSILTTLEGPCSLNLFPTENRMSPNALQAMASDAGRRYEFSETDDSFYGDTGNLGDVIKQCEEATKQFFSAKYAFVEGLSGLNTMHWVLTSFAKRDSVVAIMDPSCGGHYATERICKDFEHSSFFIPYDRIICDIDYEALADISALKQPDVVYLDISTLINLPSISKIRMAVGEKSIICFDASQVLALVPNNLDKIGLNSGLDVLNGSTHKTIPGPQKGIVLTNSTLTAEKIADRLPFVVSNMHVNATGALAITLIEMMRSRVSYGESIKQNARSLAQALKRQGLNVPGESFGFTETQQVWIEAPSAADAIALGHSLRAGNIRSTVVPLPSNGKPGLRLGVQEITRVGMKTDEMVEVASILIDNINRKDDGKRTRDRVEILTNPFKNVSFIN